MSGYSAGGKAGALGLLRCLGRVLLLLGLLLVAAQDVQAAGSAAGLSISNTASATFAVLGVPGAANSNTDIFAVDEVLDLALASNDAGSVNVTTPGSDAPQSYTLTNTGNGSEAFVLQALSALSALSGDEFDPQNVRIYLDDGDGIFVIGSDVLYVAGVNDPVLLADASRVLFVVGNIPPDLSSGDRGLVELQATAVTGSGTPGTVFVGAGVGGVDAVVGASTAHRTEQNDYVVAQVATTLVKSLSVLDTTGGTRAVRGSTITYSLLFTATGNGTVQDVLLQDVMPVGTTYVPGSLTLDGIGLTDDADDDAGQFTGTQIEVVPGTEGALSVPATALVTFKVTIN